MMKAGVPLVQSFDIVADGLDNASLKQLLRDIKTDIEGGTSFAQALRRHPKYFDDLFTSLVDAGEQAGALETMLDRLATYKEKTEALKAKIKKAMTYPIAVLVVAFIVTVILLVKVVPQFEAMFTNFGGELPAFTRLVVSMSEWAQAYWFIGIAAIGGAVFAGSMAIKKNESIATKVDAFLLKAPIFGNIVTQSAIARYCRTLATTFAAGVPLVEAWTAQRARQATGSTTRPSKPFATTSKPANSCNSACGRREFSPTWSFRWCLLAKNPERWTRCSAKQPPTTKKRSITQ